MKTNLKHHTRKWVALQAAALLALSSSPVSAVYWHGHKSIKDLDGDGTPDLVDPDIDNDGIPNSSDPNVDGGIALTGPFAGKYIGDREENSNPAEKDIDGDGLADDSLAEKDIDGDGKPDDSSLEDDIDGDGKKDDMDDDLDGDGKRNDDASEDDIDGDGRDDDDPSEDDIDGDGKTDDVDDDIDGDGKRNDDASELDRDGDGIANDDPADTDEDGDGIQDRNDSDDDNNGTSDIDEPNHQSEDGEQEVQSDLARVAAPGGSSASVIYQLLGTGSAKLTVDVRDATVGSYDLLVGGVVRGTLVVGQESSKTRGTLVFKTADSGSGDLLLDFPVAQQPVELRQGAVVFFSGTAPAAPTSDDNGGVGSDTVVLVRAPGVSAEAEAQASLEFGTSGPVELQIEVKKLPAGDYDLVIGEAVRGVVSVTLNGGETGGSIVFNAEGNAGTLPLNFPAAGQTISITQGTASFFTGQLPSAAAPPAP